MVTKEKAEKYKNLEILNKYLEGHNGYIAGGCFKNIFTDTPFRDIDIFFKNIADYQKARTLFRTKYPHKYTTQNATAFLDKENDVTIELITAKYNEPISMIKSFDFTVCQFVYFKEYEVHEKYDKNGKFIKIEESFSDYTVAYNTNFFDDLKNKKLKIDTATELKFSILNRLIKYVKYGYEPSNDTKTKIIKAIKDCNDSIDIFLNHEQQTDDYDD